MSENQKSSNVVWHQGEVSREDKEKKNGHKGAVLWFSGLSGSGKSTLSHAVENKLFQMDVHSTVLDGDNVRHGLNKDLGFTDEDRVENIRRIGELSKLMVDAGLLVMTAFISPFCSDRRMVRSLVQKHEFIEVYMETALEECERRDPKGLYKKARKGEIKNFTGIDSEYETPENPEVVVDTVQYSIGECAEQVVSYLKEHKMIT